MKVLVTGGTGLVGSALNEVRNKDDHVEWQKSETLDDTQRGQGGFGHSGKK